MLDIRRRQFITLLGGAAATWPLAARAQQPLMPVIGFLSGRSPGESESVEAAFRQGLKESGYAEGQNVHIAFRWAEGRYDRLPALVASLVDIGEDPVKLGLVASLNRPGGSATGVSMFLSEMEAKRLALLHELVPTATMIGVIVTPSSPSIDTQLREINSAARALGRQIQIVNATNERELDAAFVSLAQSKVGALLIASNAYFTSRRDQIVALAAQRAIPAIYDQREFPMAGGLVSYGTNLSDSYRLMGVYTGKVLKGEKPTDLPVQQSTKFELVINLKTAKALGLDIPATVLARADEVIE